MGNCRINKLLNAVFPADIRFNENRFQTIRSQPCRLLLTQLCADIRHHNTGAGFRECLCCCQPHTGGSARHHNTLPVEFVLHFSRFKLTMAMENNII